jgi:hypothetical protein
VSHVLGRAGCSLAREPRERVAPLADFELEQREAFRCWAAGLAGGGAYGCGDRSAVGLWFVVFRRYDGREAVRVILRAVIRVFKGFHYYWAGSGRSDPAADRTGAPRRALGPA